MSESSLFKGKINGNEVQMRVDNRQNVKDLKHALWNVNLIL